jgi:hypothetical protein
MESSPPRPPDDAASAPRRPVPVRSRDDPSKARKQVLFEEAESSRRAPPPTPKPFVEYLRTTPAAPLSWGLKLVLWAVIVVVLALLVAAIVKPRRRSPPTVPARQLLGPARVPGGAGGHPIDAVLDAVAVVAAVAGARVDRGLEIQQRGAVAGTRRDAADRQPRAHRDASALERLRPAGRPARSRPGR